MKTYSSFITEYSIEKNAENSLKSSNTIEEINKNLNTQLSSTFSSIDDALTKIKKIMSLYSIEFHYPDFPSKVCGDVFIPIIQYNVSGENFGGTVNNPAILNLNDQKLLHISFDYDDGYNFNAEVIDMSNIGANRKITTY